MKAMIAVVAGGFIALSLTTPASADQSRSKDETVVERISYTDLDLGSARGQRRLKDRISYAAYRLCLMNSTATSSPAVADPNCYRDVMHEGLAQMERAVAAAASHRELAAATLPHK